MKPHGLTLRHFPQSFEYSTLGGWIATRSGGHFASLYTHIDDFVESLRVVTPRGVLETRRLPGSGAGPSPDRMFIGSEGILGVITQAWMRLQAAPTFRAGGAVRFQAFFAAARAVRAIAQAGLYPVELPHPRSAGGLQHRRRRRQRRDHGAGFESGDHPLDAWMKRALRMLRRSRRRRRKRRAGDAHREGAAGHMAQRLHPHALRARVPDAGGPHQRHLRDLDHLGSLRGVPRRGQGGDRARDPSRRPAAKGEVTCRFTHVYPDGPAPYFSFHALGRHGALLEQWQAIKNAASDALIAAGGTITHHHAVGRDHRPWYDRQRPELFATALRAAKKRARPAGHAQSRRADRPLSSGVLIPPDLRLVPTFRSPRYIAATPFRGLRKVMGTSKSMILVPLSI